MPQIPDTPQATNFEYQSLGDILDGIESHLGKITSGIDSHPLELLLAMDEAYLRLNVDHPGPNSHSAEAAQFEYLQRSLQKNAALILKKLGGATELNRMRQTYQPASELTWWFLDQWLVKKRKASLKQILITTGIIIVILIGLALIYRRFFAPNPIDSQVYSLQMDCQDFMVQGDYPSAMQAAQSALALRPNDPQNLVMAGVIAEKMGNADAAQAYFQQAQANTSQTTFYIYRSQVSMLIQDAPALMDDSQSILDADPDSPEGYFYRAKAEEINQKYSAAVDDYEKASQLAEEQNNAQMVVTIRMNMAALMQSGGGMIPGEETPTAP